MTDNQPQDSEYSEPASYRTHYPIPSQSIDLTIGKFQHRLRNSILLKLFLTIFLGLILLIPAAMIQELVKERQTRRNEAKGEVSGKWGGEQTVGGPVLTLPYMAADTHQVYYAHFLPTELTIDGELKPEIRHRGIFDVMLYNAKTHVTGTFAKPNIAQLGIRKEQVLWNDAYVSVGIPDMHGIHDSIVLKWNETSVPFAPGIDQSDVYTSGARASMSQLHLENLESESSFSLDLNLNGSSAFRILPLGRTTNVRLKSSWNKPSFQGSFLPEVHELTNQGFTAQWKVLDLNRNIQPQWVGTSPELYGSQFGVELQTPVDNYKESDRATKYAAMFIGLTFLTFFLIEVLNRVRLHPIQYLLVGFAIIIFYLLLLSLSEQMGFGVAYLFASGAVVGLATSYMGSILKQWKMTFLIGSIFTLLYGYLYVLLQLEDWSLLMGSLGLFLILATVMYLTRKVNWYQLQSENTTLTEAAATA